MSVTTPQRARELPTELPPEAGRAAAGIFVVLLAQLMFVLDAAVTNVALPEIATDLSFGPAALSWVLNGYTLAFGGLLLLGGRLGDVLGRLRVFMAGLAIFTVASVIGGLAVTPDMLVAARALQGVGAAIAAPSVLALLTTSAPDEFARNRALALFTAISSGGAALGLILGGVLTDLLSWRWTLFINAPIGLAVLLTVGRLVTETPRRPGRFDVVGAIAATGGAVALVWSLVRAPEQGWASWQTVGGLVLAAALISALGYTESRHPHPLLRLGLLRSRPRVAALVAMASMYGGMMAMFFLMVQFLEGELGFDPLQSGLAFLPIPVSIFLLSRVAPRLVARFSQAPLMVAGTGLVLLAFLRMSTVDASDGYWSGAFPSLLGMGVAMGLAFMPMTSLALLDVEPEHAGSASGLLQTMQQLGGAVGLAVVASAYAATAVPGDFLAGGHTGFLAASALAALALTASLTAAWRRPLPELVVD